MIAVRTLVLGGTRSGKSGHAEGLLPSDAPVRYLATARHRRDDLEWEARLDTHRLRRSPEWTTVEEPDVAGLVRAGGGPLLVDDLATWLTHVLDDAGAWDAPAPGDPAPTDPPHGGPADRDGTGGQPAGRQPRETDPTGSGGSTGQRAERVAERIAALVDAVRCAPGRVVLVSAEVGLGVVPATRAGRLFRDELGALNAALAAVCDEVLLLVAGLPLRLK